MGRGGEGHEKTKKKPSPNMVGDKISFMIPWEGRGVIDMISFSGFKMILLLGDAPPNPYLLLNLHFLRKMN